LPTIEALKKLDGFHGAQVYLVGGYVRDLIRRKRNYDIDVVVRGIDYSDIRKFLNAHGKTKLINLTFDVPIILFKAFRDNIETQIALPRNRRGEFKPDNTLRSDASCRDFTINAMYLPINYKSRNDLIDFFGGYRDIKKRILVPIVDAESRIKESPIRILRALSLASRTKYRIRGDIMTAIKKHVDFLKMVPPDLIRKELNKILINDKPSRYFKIMHKLGILKIIMPELDMCVGVKQDKRYHKYDVFKHCVYTCDNIDPDLVLRLAAVLHDIGKPQTRKESGKRVTFYRHEIVSTQLAKDILQRLRYDKETTKKVLHLIRLHMYHYVNDVYVCTGNNIGGCNCLWKRLVRQTGGELEVCPKCGSSITIHNGWSDAAVRRFIKKAGISRDDLDDLSSFPLFKLRAAERKGNGFKTIAVTDRQRDFEERIGEVFGKSRGLEINDLDIDGSVIMDLFNIEQSPKVGEILNYLLEKVLSEPKLNNRIELIKLAAEYIYCKT